MEENNCEKCSGECCRYVTVVINKPEDEEDFEEIKWFISHKNVRVYLDDEGDWCVEFLTPCNFLDENNRCTNYENRPGICRGYCNSNCTFVEGFNEKILFKSIEDVEKYVKEMNTKSDS